MTRSDDVINEDGHDVIAAHTRVVRGMAAALAAIAATGAGVTAAAANVMFTFALDTKAKRSMFNMPHEETPKGIEFDMSAYRNFCGALDWFSLSVGGVGVSRGGVEFVPVDAGPVCGRDAVVRFGRRCLFALPQGVGDE
jgi:hypothetical protein